MGENWLLFYWTGPIGLGIGLALIGVFVLLLALAKIAFARPATARQSTSRTQRSGSQEEPVGIYPGRFLLSRQRANVCATI